MAEAPVSQNQHGSDMAEPRLELANMLALLDKRTESTTTRRAGGLGMSPSGGTSHNAP